MHILANIGHRPSNLVTQWPNDLVAFNLHSGQEFNLPYVASWPLKELSTAIVSLKHMLDHIVFQPVIVWSACYALCVSASIMCVVFRWHVQGSYGQGKSGNFEGVRESQGKQRGSGKSQGILKYCSLDQLFMHYFHNFCRLLGALPPDPHRSSAPVNTAG